MAAQLAALQQAVTSHKAVEQKLAQSEAKGKALEDKVASQKQALAESASEQEVINSQVRQRVINSGPFGTLHASVHGPCVCGTVHL